MQKIKFFLLFVMLQALLFADIKPDQSTTKPMIPSVSVGDGGEVLLFVTAVASLLGTD